jgi:hypothetical protein
MNSLVFIPLFQLIPGVIVFNDRAAHRGGATVDTQRLVMRFIATGTSLEDKLLYIKKPNKTVFKVDVASSN